MYISRVLFQNAVNMKCMLPSFITNPMLFSTDVTFKGNRFGVHTGCLALEQYVLGVLLHHSVFYMLGSICLVMYGICSSYTLERHCMTLHTQVGITFIIIARLSLVAPSLAY